MVGLNLRGHALLTSTNNGQLCDSLSPPSTKLTIHLFITNEKNLQTCAKPPLPSFRAGDHECMVPYVLTNCT